MAQPRGFVDPQFPSYACKLNKALYGLKQAPQVWLHKLSHAILQWGFQASRADSSMFFRHLATDVLILLVYVDDLLVTGSNSSQVSSFISYLNSTFAICDLRCLNYFLSIEVIHYGSRMHLSQHKYVQDLLARTNMLDSKLAHTPGILGRTLSQHDGPPFLDIKLYHSTVGALQYVTLTRPDIAFVVNKACQFMTNPTETHWLVVKRILCYLKGTSSYGLQLHQAKSLDLYEYTNADWVSCLDDCRSTNEYCLFLGPNLISWSSTKQRLVSRNSAKSKYRGLASLTS